MVSRGEPKDGTGINAAAKVATDRNIGSKTKPDGILKCVTEFLGIFGIWACRRGFRFFRVVEIPILVQLDALLGCHHVMGRRNLKDTVEECT